MLSLLYILLRFFFYLVHINNMKLLLSLFGLVLWPYYDLIVSHASFITFLLTMSNLMFYFLHSQFTSSQRLLYLLPSINA